MVKEIKFFLNSIRYSPGSTVQGKLKVTVDKPKKYKSILVTLWGGAKVHWTEQQGSGEHQSTVTYKNSETYVHVQQAVWAPENSLTGDLPVGEHYFPFGFQLPHNAPSSFVGAHGQILYELEARIVQSGAINSMLKSNHKIKSLLTVQGGTSSSRLLRLYSEPVTIDKTKRLNVLFFKFGSVSTTIHLPRTGFSPGETIPISAHVNNQSSRQVRVASILRRRDTFTASRGRQRVVTSPVARTLSSHIMPRMVTTFEDRNLKIPVQAQETMRSCSCISVEYILTVKVLIPWSFNLKAKIPIVIAHGDSSSTSVVGSQPQQTLSYRPPQPSSSYNLGSLSSYSPAPRPSYSPSPQPPYNLAPQPSYNPAAPLIISQEPGPDPFLPSYDEAVRGSHQTAY